MSERGGRKADRCDGSQSNLANLVGSGTGVECFANVGANRTLRQSTSGNTELDETECLVVERSGDARLPIGSGWSHIRGLAVLGGIGFTVSLFVTELAFDDPAMADLAKIGIFAGSAIAAVAGYYLLRKAPVPTER